MGKNAFFDYAAIVILGLLIISVITRRMLKGRQNRDFLGIAVIAFLTVMCDAATVAFARLGPGYIPQKLIFHTLYLLFHSITLPYYMVFIIHLTGSEHKTLRNPSFRILIPIPLEAEIFVLALNLFTRKLFYFDEAGNYTRGPLFFINYLVAAFYLLVSLYILFRYRKTMSTGRFLSIFLLYPAIATSVAIQYFNPNLLIEMFIIAVCFLYVALVVIRPEENIDADTGFQSFTSYVDSLRQVEVTGKHMVVVLLNISNFRSMYRALGYKSFSNLIYKVAFMISDECIRTRIHAEYYYLGNGRFRLICDNNDRPLVSECAKSIQKKLYDGFPFRDVEISLLTNACILHWPEDVSDEKSIMLFDSQYDDLPYRQGVMYGKEVMRQKNFDILLSLDKILEDALKYRRFEVYYQPIYSVKKKRFTTAEALIRLNTEEYGFVPPDLFIPVAEQNGTIHKIGHYVLEEVCRFIAEDDFPELGVSVIDVNLSTVQCLEKNLAKDISQILGAYNVNPKQINLEITESAATFEYSELMTNIENLSARGFHFSLDDYGTGYSNLSRAMEMPLSIIKLDKSITQVDQDSRLYAIGAHSVRMIKEMKMEVVAEGVETEEVLKKYEEMGCDYIQGYYFSKPLPKEEFKKFILDWNSKNPLPEETGMNGGESVKSAESTQA